MAQGAPAVIGALRELRPAVVHCNDLPSLYVAGPLARTAGVPVVWNIRGMTNVRGWKWLAGRALADEIVTLSREMKKAIDHALPRSRIPRAAEVRVVYSSVDTDAYAPVSDSVRAELRSRLGISESDFAVGLIAPVVALKQQAELVDALAASLPRVGERWWFVGDYDPTADAYARSVQQRLTSVPAVAAAVQTPGYTDRVADFYRAMDVVVVCSKEEGLARCMIEALACGTPVVSFALTSAREVLEEGGCGLVVDCQDFPSLLARVRELRDRREHRRRLGAAGRELAVARFGGSQGVKAYEAIYSRLAASRRG
jgi:glycosyltransferase involved in cell wall biosynthesis